MLFGSASRGIPSFGDLAWKRPVKAATDPSTTYDAPLPTLSPAGTAVFGQTLTAGANGALSGETPFVGLTLAVGDRVLTVASHGVANSAGIWVVTSLGSAGAPWVLTRATDGDSTAELVTGAATLATQYALTGAVYDYGFLIRESTGVWSLRPNTLDILTVVTSLEVGDGALDPPMVVNGGIDLEGNGLVLNQDTRIQRTAVETLTIDDAAAGNLTLLKILATSVYSTTGTSNPTVAGEGSATFSGKTCVHIRLGKLVVFYIDFTVTANGSGATNVSMTNTGLPQAAAAGVFAMGGRSVVGIVPLGWRMLNSGGELTVGQIRRTDTDAIITGAQLVNTASYTCWGVYLTA